MQPVEKKSSEKNKEKVGVKTWEILFKFHHFIGLFLVTVLAAAVYLSPAIDWNVVRMQFVSKQEQTNSVSRCNLFSGKWIYDNVSYPLYREEQCSFLTGFACHKNGRTDHKYQNWRWQPHQCDLPRFNGKAFLEKIRGKRLVYVGDSLMRNQWKSMLCLIESSLPPSSNKTLDMKGNRYIFHSHEYNATIEVYWSPFLVESNCDGVTAHSGVAPTVKIKAIEKHARVWNDADILIFDSFIWWTEEPGITILWGSFGSPNATHKTLKKSLRPYEIALRSWSNWLEINIDRNKTKLYFMSNSPTHHGGEVWCGYQQCYGESEPITKEGMWGCGSDRGVMSVAESAIEKLQRDGGLKVEYLNVTQLSGYRKDAHPSIYKLFLKKDPDCTHWCLPGVPDVWNQIFYAYFMDRDKYI